ncbi:MAG TPA: MFS transporter [Terracidiphilus sp.]|nr:MFS transporter [Terracidiphilus sp.]
MPVLPRSPSVRTLAVLHPVFALTGVLHTVGGALLPSLAARFHLNDSTSGLLFLLYFAGTSLGALLCRGNYARLITIGFAAMVCTCLAVSVCPRSLLAPVFLLLGISVGVPMSAVTLFVGHTYPARCAPLLTFLNFSWSIGALAAPLIAARVLMHHSYQASYVLFASASAVAAFASALVLSDPPEPARAPSDTRSNTAFYLIAIFAFAAFLQVGIENTVAAWLPTYALRTAAAGLVLAAASTSFYWAGFLCSRGLSSLLLLRAEPMRVFRIAVGVAFASALLLEFAPSLAARNIAMFLLGASLAPTYPLVLAAFFARSRHTADSRWILFTAGFGGSVLPWIAGFVSTHTGSLRTGMLTIPAALLVMAFLLLALRNHQPPVPTTQ